MSKQRKPYLFSLFLGDFLSHFDSALFWVLSPFLAPLLFPTESALEGLALFYLLIPLSKWARPIGALILGKWSVRIGPHKTLLISLSGLALACLGMVFCPTQDPFFAFGWVLFCRMAMYFFSSTESSSASWMILRDEQEKKGLMSGLIGSVHLFGYIFAALIVSVIAMVGSVEDSWRWIYLFGAMTGMGAMFLRIVYGTPTEISSEILPPKKPSKPHKWFNKKSIALIALATCFSYGTYEVCMSIAYSALPVITVIQKTHLLWLNLGLLTFDALLLPWFGQMAEKWGKERCMAAAAFIWALCCGIFLDLLHGANFLEITLIRTFLVTIGVAFAAPFYSWTVSLLPKNEEILHLSFGSALGKYIGGFIPSSIFFLYHHFQSFLIASIPLVIISFATGIVLIKQVSLTSAAKTTE